MFAEGVFVKSSISAGCVAWIKLVVNSVSRKIIECTNKATNKTKTKPSLFTHWIWKFHYFSGVVVTTAAVQHRKRNVIRIEQ